MDQDRLVISQPFELHMELVSWLISPTHAILYLSYGLMNSWLVMHHSSIPSKERWYSTFFRMTNLVDVFHFDHGELANPSRAPLPFHHCKLPRMLALTMSLGGESTISIWILLYYIPPHLHYKLHRMSALTMSPGGKSTIFIQILLMVYLPIWDWKRSHQDHQGISPRVTTRQTLSILTSSNGKSNCSTLLW